MNEVAGPARCANCGASLADRYCGRCGQDSRSYLVISIVYFVLASLFDMSAYVVFYALGVGVAGMYAFIRA